jgi:hypothetical protein
MSTRERNELANRFASMVLPELAANDRLRPAEDRTTLAEFDAPWRVVKEDENYAQVVDQLDRLVADGWTVKTARLIAAAPELLDMVKSLKNWHDAATQRAAEALIARIEGRE